jgi:predicted lactoylglutathione lyase
MIKELWINLPVKDVKKSKEFFTKMGFSFNSKYGDTEHSVCMIMGTKNIAVMLFAEVLFKGFTQQAITDTKQSSEILLSFDAESREEVDELARKAGEAGGDVFAKPGESQGWLYGCAFADLDGHRWNILHMDMSKMPK